MALRPIISREFKFASEELGNFADNSEAEPMGALQGVRTKIPTCQQVGQGIGRQAGTIILDLQHGALGGG